MGVAGAVVGAVSGAISVSDAESLSGSKSCSNGVCNAAEASTISTYHVVTKLTTIGMVAGVAGLGFGIPALVVTSSGDHAAKDAHAMSVEPWVALGCAGVRGTF